MVTPDVSVKKKKKTGSRHSLLSSDTLGLEGDPDWRGDVDSCDNATSWEDGQ